MIIMGIDPGSRVTGYGLIEKEGDYLKWICDGQICPSKNLSFHDRVFNIFLKIKEVIEKYEPDEVAVEDLFHSKNAKSSLKLGHVRGAIIVAVLYANLPVFEYTPLEIKRAITGYGKATKEQVRDMVRFILGLNKEIKTDSSDALAVAICHANRIDLRKLRDDSLYKWKACQ